MKVLGREVTGGIIYILKKDMLADIWEMNDEVE